MPANIGTLECGKRRLGGVVTLLVTAAAAGALIAFGAARSWRLVLILPWYIAMLGFFQARDKT